MPVDNEPQGGNDEPLGGNSPGSPGGPPEGGPPGGGGGGEPPSGGTQALLDFHSLILTIWMLQVTSLLW